MVWICPLCEQPLVLLERTWACANHHCFDQSKEGYVNLLPAHKKRSKTPGDSVAMINARRLVHDNALYAPLAAQITAIINDCSSVQTVLDIGCGEGYYGDVLTRHHPDLTVYGIDIAKAAVKLAAATYRHHHYAVAGASHLPVDTATIDLALSIFAPINDTELRRALRAGGYFLEVGPAPRHLWELRTALYDEPREHEPSERTRIGLSSIAKGTCNYSRTLDNTLIQALLTATPFAYRGHREKRAVLRTLTYLNTTLSFSWRLYQNT